MTLGDSLCSLQNFFPKITRATLGDGRDSLFWSHQWFGNGLMKHVFLDMYRFAADISGSIADMGEWVDGRWRWNFKWVDASDFDDSFVGAVLSNLLKGVQLMYEGRDWWKWSLEKNHFVTVKSCYTFLLSAVFTAGVDIVTKEVLSDLWRLSVPTKIGVFR